MPGCGANDSGFHALGGFASKAQQAEDARMIGTSLRRYPLMHLRAAVYELGGCSSSSSRPATASSRSSRSWNRISAA